jgi:hypothetical protein
MRTAHSLHPSTSILFRAVFLLLFLPLSGAGLRAQGTGLTLGLSAADHQTLAAHLLTMEDMRKFVAVGSQLAEVAKRDPKVCALIGQSDEDSASPGNRSIAERAKAMDAEPFVRNALRASGVTAEEYVVIMLAYVTTMADNVTRMTGRSLFAEPVPVHPGNRTFLMSHEEEIGKLMEAIPAFCEG